MEIVDLQVEPLQKANADESVALLAQSFCANDPMEVVLQISEAEFEEMVRADLQSIFDDRLSICIRSSEGLLIGVCVVVDANFEFASQSDQIASKFRPVAEIVNKLHHPYIANHSFVKGEAAYIYMGAVSSASQGRGIATTMFAKMEDLLRKERYRSVFTITTNWGSMKALQKNGYEVISEIAYQGFLYDNQPVFDSIEGQRGLALMEKQL